MRVTVTGGAGFIGNHLCHALCALPWVGQVTVLDDLSRESGAALPPAVSLVQGSILDQAALRYALARADAVIHLAARSSVAESVRDPVGTYLVNAMGTAHVFEAARLAGARMAVLASSSAVYGNCPRLPLGESEPARPVSPYGASKLAAESYALACAATYRLPVLALRLFNVFGPGQEAREQDGAVVPTFVSAALRGEPLPVNGDGSQSRDFVHVEDVCRVVVAAVHRGVAHHGPVNVAGGRATTLRELIALIADAADRHVRLDSRPARPGDVRASQADVTLVRRLFPGWEPTPLRDGLAVTVKAAAPLVLRR